MLNETSLLIGLMGFLGGLLGAAISNFFASQMARQERQEARRKERFDFLSRSLTALIEYRGELQSLQNQSINPGIHNREVAYGKAYAIMLSLNDVPCSEQALMIMKGGWDEEKGENKKLSAIDFGIDRLGALLADLSKNKNALYQFARALKQIRAGRVI